MGSDYFSKRINKDNTSQIVASAPPVDQPVIVQQVFVVQQPGTQPVYVGDQVVQPGQQVQYLPPVYNQQQPLIQPQVVNQQPQQQFEEEPRKRQRHVSNGDPRCVTWCCHGVMVVEMLLNVSAACAVVLF